jgi:signal recognition particle subunit SRP54
MASRILGMGDIVTLVEKAQAVVDEKEAEKSATRLMSGKWNFEDFLKQLHTVKKMGPLKQLMGMIPGMGGMLKQVDFTGDELKPIEAIISSMTFKERRNPELLSGRTGGSRRRRIAKGSGTSVQDVNALVKQFKAMKRMIGDLGRMGDLGSLMTPGGIEKALPRLPGGKALMRQKQRGGSQSKKDKKDKRRKNKNKRKRARR